ncbi:hypothetical protein [Alloprevotella tannerae]
MAESSQAPWRKHSAERAFVPVFLTQRTYMGALSGKILKQRGSHATRLATFLANEGEVLNNRYEQVTQRYFLVTDAKVVTKYL